MRIVAATTIIASFFALSACATSGAPQSGAACSDMIKPGTLLYNDVYNSKGTRNCGLGHDLANHSTTTLAVDVQLDPTTTHNVSETQPNDFPAKLSILMGRFDENVTPTADQPTTNGDWPGRILPGEINVRIVNQTANAKVFRLDEKTTQITMGCLTVVVTGQRGTPTKVLVCRSIGKFASDDLVRQKAYAIAAHDLPDIVP